MGAESWRRLSKADQKTLRDWVCTDPAKATYDRHRGKHHPRPWELHVQSHIRGLRPKTEPNLWGGFEGDTLMAICQLHYDARDEWLKVCVVSRSITARGLGWGDKTLNHCIQLAAAWPDSGRAVDLYAQIHAENTPSQNLFLRHGFEPLNNAKGDLHTWSRLAS